MPAVVKTAAPAAVPVMAAVAAPPAAAVGAREPASAQPVAAVPAPAVQAAAAPVLAAPKTSDVLAPAAPAAPAAGSAGALRAVALPALLLAGLAVAAFMFARRRRGFVERHIQILETTTLGPKRSLVVARVGDQMLLLGSSEAGITLLQTRSEAAIASAAAATTTGTAAAISDGPPAVREAAAATAPVAPPIEDFDIETSLPIEEALADIPEPDHGRSLAARSGFRAIEGGLASLFRARAVTADWVNEDKQGGEQSAEQSAESDRFDDLLEDSIEDQELRRKLAAGMSARVR
ncbi:MAG: flagellar biosynthetic protein FliO [Pseudomonadota bacterium]